MPDPCELATVAALWFAFGFAIGFPVGHAVRMTAKSKREISVAARPGKLIPPQGGSSTAPAVRASSETKGE